MKGRNLLLLGLTVGLVLLLLGCRAATPAPTPVPTKAPVPAPQVQATTPPPAAPAAPGVPTPVLIRMAPGTKYTALSQPYDDPTLKYPSTPAKDWAAKDIVRGGVLVHGLPWTAPNWDPVFAVGSGTGYVGKAETVQERLVYLKRESGQVSYEEYYTPGLAKTWEISADMKTWTFRLEQGVKFQNVPPVNGREMTSADVKFSFDYYMKLPSLLQSQLQDVSSIETPDKYTVVIRLKVPSAWFLLNAGFKGMFILPREVFDRDGDFKGTLIGTGPFIMTKHIEQEVFESKKNPDYWKNGEDGKPLPYLDGFIERVIPDRAARTAAYRAGQLDVPFGILSTLEEADKLLATNPKTRILQVLPVENTWNIQWCNTCPPFDNVELRRALSMGINREGILASTFLNQGVIATSLTWVGTFDRPPAFADIVKQWPWYAFNPQKAKAELARLGYSKGLGPGEIVFFNYSAQVTQMIEVVAQDWTSNGLMELKPKQIDYTSESFMNTSGSYDDPKDGKVGPLKMVWSAGQNPVTLYYDYLHSKGADNYYRINDPEIDKLADEMKVTLDAARVKEIRQKLYNRAMDQAYFGFLPNSNGYAVQAPWVKNLSYRMFRQMGEPNASMGGVWMDSRDKYK
ncbi:MAG: ABC transporter substrate-binding protein [Chloroflexi bacterium]|nr:ABC transporter substrate-binding protein [Chloroflexota bacterium]